MSLWTFLYILVALPGEKSVLFHSEKFAGGWWWHCNYRVSSRSRPWDGDGIEMTCTWPEHDLSMTWTQNFNQPSKHPRYMVKCTQLGANPSVPNWVHNLCSKLGFLRQIPHSRILLIYVPNWVHNSYTQLGAKNMYPIGCKESVPNWVHKYILSVLFELYVCGAE